MFSSTHLLMALYRHFSLRHRVCDDVPKDNRKMTAISPKKYSIDRSQPELSGNQHVYTPWYVHHETIIPNRNSQTTLCEIKTFADTKTTCDLQNASTDLLFASATNIDLCWVFAKNEGRGDLTHIEEWTPQGLESTYNTTMCDHCVYDKFNGTDPAICT